MGAKVRQDNVVALNHCNILTLLATDFHEVMGRFPSVRGIFQTLLFEMNSQEHAERRRRQTLRRPSSVLILPELRRMGAITPSSTDTTDEGSPAHSILDIDTNTKPPTSQSGPPAVPKASRKLSVCILSPAVEEEEEEEEKAEDDPSAAVYARESRDPGDGGRRDGSDVGGTDAGGSSSRCKQS